MGKRFDSDKVLALKAKYNLAEVVQESITNLRHAGGGEWVGTCPFHDGDNTPSFRVNAERYHCFGCRKHGDILSWLILTRGLTFRQAVEALGGNALPDATQVAKPRRIKNYSDYDAQAAWKIMCINRQAQRWFLKQLNEVPGGYGVIEYLNNRNLNPKEFRLGYAAHGAATSLIDYLKNHGVSEEDIVITGLAAKDQYGKLYPRLRDRITIPLMNRTGYILGFAGRIIPRPENEGLPKYVNPPNTHAFSRKRYLFGCPGSLYGLDRQRKPALLVEGFFDCIRIRSFIGPCVYSTLGTAITPEQVRTLEDRTTTVYVMMDGDMSGLNAAVQSLNLFLETDLKVQVVLLTDGQDPDTYFNRDPDEALKLLRSLPRARLEDFFTAKLTVKMAPKYDRTKLDELAKPFVDSNIKDGFGHFNVIAWVCAAYPKYAQDIRTSFRSMLDNAYETEPGKLGFKEPFIKAFLRAWAKPCREVRKKHAK